MKNLISHVSLIFVFVTIACSHLVATWLNLSILDKLDFLTNEASAWTNFIQHFRLVAPATEHLYN